MGWSSGTEMMERIVQIYDSLHGDANEEVRIEFYREMVELMQDHDWDTLDEVEGLSWALDQALHELNDS